MKLDNSFVSHYYNVASEPRIIINRVRLTMKKNGIECKITHKMIADELGMKLSTFNSMCYHKSMLFSLYVIKWCIVNNYDIESFIKKGIV